MAGIGVAICDSKDELIYELKKPLDLSECDIVSRRSVEERVLIEALRAAVALDLKRIVLYCDYYPLYQFVSGQWRPKQQKIINFLDQVNLLRKSFTYCEPSFIARKDVKFAFKLAREAISSETSNAASSQEKLENCVICLDDKSIDHFFAVEGCTHRYCYSCVRQQVEVKLLNGVLPKCPHEGCENELRFESCEKFLNPKFIEMMRERLKEDSIPVTEKVYCPYPKCSALMSKTEVLKLPGMINEVGAVTCYKCHGSFCINCRVPWHNDMNCAEYKGRSPTLIVEESKLKSLAAKNFWRQCIKCQHMIELAAGCYHMTCRCGYEFCYTCGAEWKNKKATCTCPLWDEEHIMDIEEEEDEDDDFEHNFVLQNDNFGHNVVLEDVFGHYLHLEDNNFGGDVAREDDDFGHNVVHENDVFEDDGFGHDVVLEGDDFEDDNVHENDDFEEVLLDNDVHENDNFEDEVLEDDVLEEEHEQEDGGNDFEDDVYDDFGNNDDAYDDYGDDVDVYDDYGDGEDVYDNDYYF
ncbi:E3 ubiquitin-protein ligase RSL1-like [Bidens hawaiensis]|uniref:E3 ubiquitin-protein ligase RSL1-like n=1 Tax=Bidens hawaiensis TaxID=980011 RepID=UPI00404A08B3